MYKICNKIHQKSTKFPFLEPPWGPLGTILAAFGNQDAPKRRPRAPRRRQNGSTWFNLAPTWRPRAPQILSKRSPRPFQIHFYNKFGAFVAPFSICIDFHLIFWIILKSLKPAKYWFSLRENAIFYKIAIFDKNAKNILKILFKPSQNPPKPSQNPPKIHSKSMRNEKKWIQHPKNVEEAPKSEK